jgi:serpin B
VDFIQDTENSRQTINQWVEEQTNHRIKDLLPDGSVTRDTRLVLTNAIYFLGDWHKQFRASNTHTSAFYVSPSEQFDVSMMNQVSSFRYAELPEAQILEMPYEGDDVSMVLMLPREEHGVEALDEWLNADTFGAAVDALDRRYVSVSLPKFTIESDLPLTATLQEMGMQTPFSWSADFTGMADASLAISDVVHKAFLRVDEKGTEAAAATGVVVGITSALPSEPDAYFRADHPFLLALRDNRTDSLLFLGRVLRPDPAEDQARDQDVLSGDFNGDGKVDQGDLDVVLLDWGANASGHQILEGWRIGRADGPIDQGELDAVLLNWGDSLPTLGHAGVPEPAAWILALIFVAAASGLQRRRQRVETG